MWHIVASLVLEPKAQLLMEVDPLFYDLYERIHHGRKGPFKGSPSIREPLASDYNVFLEKEGLISPGNGESSSHVPFDMFNLAKRLRQHVKISQKHYRDIHIESSAGIDGMIQFYDALLKYMASENSTLRLLESSNISSDRYHLVENKGNLASTKGSYQSRAIDAVISDPHWHNITGYIGTHNAASTIIARQLQQDVPNTCKTIMEKMGKVSRPEVLDRVRSLVSDAIASPNGGRVLLLNMRCAPYNRHQNVTVNMLHQIIERVANYNKTHAEKLYIRPLGAFTTHNQGSKEDIDKIKLADFIASYTRNHPGAPILPPLDFYGRLASLETTVDTRMVDPSFIMEFWRQISKEPQIAGVLGGRSGALHIASYAFANPAKIMVWDIPYSINAPSHKKVKKNNAGGNLTYRHQDFVRFAIEHPILSIIPLSNGRKLHFEQNSLELMNNFLSGQSPSGLSKEQLRQYLGTSKDYMPYLRVSPSLQPPEDMQQATSKVSVIGEDIMKWFATERDKAKVARG